MSQEMPMYGRIFTMPAKENRNKCCICRQYIEPGSEVQRNQNNGCYKHLGCQPKNGKRNVILGEEEQRKANQNATSIPRHGRVIRGTRSLS